MIAGLAMMGAVWSGPLAQAPPREVWVAIREDGEPGAGTVNDPFDASSVEKLNALFERFTTEFGNNLTVHFGPGAYEGDRTWEPRSNWKLRGAGIDITIFRTRADPNATETVGFRAGGYTGGPVGVEVSDMTFDFNTPNLRHANRAFVWGTGRPYVSYVCVDSPPEWSADTEYPRGKVVALNGAEYIAVEATPNEQPAQGESWSILCPNRADALPAWQADKRHAPGDAVASGEMAYLCLRETTGGDLATDAEHWSPLDPNAPDPLIYTHAVFMHARPPDGGHRVERVKAINGNGSWFFGREAFVIGLGGNDCVIEDCVVEQFHGDYASLIVTTFGQHGVIRGCTVRGNDGYCTMAYGGWACWDTVFENNFCTNVRSATNIDSLNCRNVTFRDNVFVDCREVGILVNVSGNVIENHRAYSMVIDGETVEIARSCVDGLFVQGNLIQMRDGAPYGAIQAQTEGLSNVLIQGNVLRTTSGTGQARAIGVLRATNVLVRGNLCEPGMYCEAIGNAVSWQSNRDLLGQPMRDRSANSITDTP